MIKNKITQKEVHALSAVLLCLIFFIIIPFILVHFLPASADWLRKQNLLLMSPAIIIGLLLKFITGETLLKKSDFINIPFGRISLWSIGMIFLCGAASLVWIKLLEILQIDYSKEVPINDMIRSCADTELIFAGIFICILIPVFEEIIFRRMIFEGINDRCPPAFSTAVTSLLFAALHGILFQLFPLLLLGVYFQLLYNKERKLGLSIYAHVFNNTIAFSALLLLRYMPV